MVPESLAIYLEIALGIITIAGVLYAIVKYASNLVAKWCELEKKGLQLEMLDERLRNLEVSNAGNTASINILLNSSGLVKNKEKKR